LPAQLIVQAPDEQTSFARQAFPHAPQLAASLEVSVHWPAHIMARPGQAQAPPEQTRPCPHAEPQPPQFETLAWVSTQVAPQAVSGAVHWEVQVPWSHT
jgi:hypothetical protein